jgi:hypothetical protein
VLAPEVAVVRGNETDAAVQMFLVVPIDESVHPDLGLLHGQKRFIRVWGCKPEPPKIPSSQFQARHKRIQVDHLAVALEGVVPVQQDVPPSRR